MYRAGAPRWGLVSGAPRRLDPAAAIAAAASQGGAGLIAGWRNEPEGRAPHPGCGATIILLACPQAGHASLAIPRWETLESLSVRPSL